VGPGQCFGELALLSGEARAANVMALDNSEVSSTLLCGQLNFTVTA
jgi:CRP-like cAMP-binding protein